MSTKQKPVFDSERYTDAMVYIRENGSEKRSGFVWCNRTRCNNKVTLQEETENEPERRWRYYADAVVVSMADGTRRKAYCSERCAGLDLMNMDRSAHK